MICSTVQYRASMLSSKAPKAGRNRCAEHMYCYPNATIVYCQRSTAEPNDITEAPKRRSYIPRSSPTNELTGVSRLVHEWWWGMHADAMAAYPRICRENTKLGSSVKCCCFILRQC